MKKILLGVLPILSVLGGCASKEKVYNITVADVIKEEQAMRSNCPVVGVFGKNSQITYPQDYNLIYRVDSQDFSYNSRFNNLRESILLVESNHPNLIDYEHPVRRDIFAPGASPQGIINHILESLLTISYISKTADYKHKPQYQQFRNCDYTEKMVVKDYLIPLFRNNQDLLITSIISNNDVKIMDLEN